MSLSADGNTALVGASFYDSGIKRDQGTAYVFVRNGTMWTQQAQLNADDGADGDQFGYSVSLSADGSIALVGASWDNVGANVDQGSAYVFVRSGTMWTQRVQLFAVDGAQGDNFGTSVSLNADGSTALVGAAYDGVGLTRYQGAAYVFVRSGTTWSQEAQLTADELTYHFGASVSLNADGSTALVGGIYDTVGATHYQGAAYVFTRSGTMWTQRAQLTASYGAEFDEFGRSVSLNADGSTVLVGVPYDDVGANVDQGSAWVFSFQ